MNDSAGDSGHPTPLHDRVDFALTEARVVLPGAQAMLGFQFVTMLTQAFERLPNVLKYVHLLSLAMIAIAVILLMTPAAYHRIVERGDETERLFRLTGRLVLAAMVPIALGLSGDFAVVVAHVTHSLRLAFSLAAVALAAFIGAWFVFPTARAAALSRRRPADKMPGS